MWCHIIIKIGTFPKGSMWRKNPVPMCNCDIGTKCANYDSEASDAEKKVEEAKEMNRRMIADFTSGGKTCKAVPKGQCGTSAGKNTCELCAPGAGYDCLVCCPGTTKTKAGPYTYCKPGSSTKCDPSDSSTYRTCYGIPYNETYLKPNQKLEECTFNRCVGGWAHINAYIHACSLSHPPIDCCLFTPSHLPPSSATSTLWFAPAYSVCQSFLWVGWFVCRIMLLLFFPSKKPPPFLFMRFAYLYDVL